MVEAQVVVLGSGSAGSTAAIAAARTGADTLLIERYGFLGGTSTMVLDTFYGFYTPADNAVRVVNGIPWEIVERLYAYDMVIERPSSYGAGQAVTYDPTTLKVVWEQTALAAGARLLLHTFCLDVLMEGDEITGLVVASKKVWVSSKVRCLSMPPATPISSFAAARRLKPPDRMDSPPNR